ncbi:hypothetical protein K458DRAFT_395396 [Lentithecium fluviatile CBS 122367]|uniref:Uncharacterized protein n=1 Tax=Lentithecium fluviatile CBS 122367 TaxID=1168545 RepID=A0A6G1IJ54_9PLEO|nr:hypothetical protein K458DRAFT_395396 [Lentithecium fluviatile CBS 122367]
MSGILESGWSTLNRWLELNKCYKLFSKSKHADGSPDMFPHIPRVFALTLMTGNHLDKVFGKFDLTSIVEEDFYLIGGHQMHGRRCFVTTKSDFGITPNDTLSGDIVVGFTSASVNIVLRRTTKPQNIEKERIRSAESSVMSSACDEEYWRVIGDCYFTN